ncbi:MAG: hypothetical protein WCL06_06985 [Bacteroidota bacterium]
MKTPKRPFKKKDKVSYCGQTELTPELLQILEHFDQIAFVKACGKNIQFYIVGQKPQLIAGRFRDIVCLLYRRKAFCKIHCSYLVNMDYVFVWATHNDGLRLLMRTEEDFMGRTQLTLILPDAIAASKFTPEGVNKMELAIRLCRGHILPVSETFTSGFKKKICLFPYIKRVWQTIGLRTEKIVNQ